MTGNIFEKQFNVRYYEVDFCGRLRPSTILNFMQDAAAGHAALLGVAVAELRKRNLTWVLSRFHLKVERYARSGETVQIRTWPSSRDGHFSCREFEVRDGEGGLLALATSSWAAVSLQTRRPVLLDDHLPAYTLVPRRAVEDEFPTLPRLGEAGTELRFQVRRSDLDINRHVNNVVYAEWALETVPAEIAESCCPAEIEIGFRAEALYGDTVISRTGRAETSNDGFCFVHQLLDERDGRELTRLRTRWREF